MTDQRPIYRNQLPQMGSKMFIADGGLETCLIFLQEIELPLFAAFPLIGNDEGVNQLNSYYAPYIDIALANKSGIILDTPTWRARRMCSRVCGMGPSAALTTRIAPSIWAAPVIMFLM